MPVIEAKLIERDHRTVRPPAGRGLSYVPALDGVRALAIVLVLFYHGGWSWAQGGFIGVDVFFVLSGFLITTLLVQEHRDRGGIALGRFWKRRALRLFPVLLATLVLVSGYAAFIAPPDTLATLRADMLATLFYVANWHQAFSGQGYFAQLGAPSPLLHTWSLAIEEQFYLVWPVVVLVVLRLTRSLRALLGLAIAGIGASAVAMAWLYAGGAGVNRVYYGTDTRAQDLLVGAALAVVMLLRAPGELDHRAPTDRLRHAGRLLLGGGGALSLAFLCWITVSAAGGSKWIYDGGFLVAGLASACLVSAAVLIPSSRVARVLSLRSVRYIGSISYGLYLWHWPIFLILDRARTGVSGPALFALRIGAALLVAAASYHLLEMPIRRGSLLLGWKGWTAAPVSVGVTSAILLASTAGAVASAPGLTLMSAPAAGVDAGTKADVPSAPPNGGGPLRILLVGDSLAATLAWGQSSALDSKYGVQIVTDAVLGCGLVTDGQVTNLGKVGPEDIGIRNTGAIQCPTWPVRWRADVQQFRPDVVLVLDGPWEVRDRDVANHWMHIGQPDFDRLEAAALAQALDSLGSSGARVELLTSPYYSQPEQANGQPWPADDPRRVDRYNQLLQQAAARDPAHAGVLDMGALVSPGGRFSTTVHGISMRMSDGVHFTNVGARWTWNALLPRVVALARAHRAHALAG